MASVFLFDIDGTLLNSGQAGQAAMEETLQSEFSVENLDCDIPYAGRTDRSIIFDLLDYHNLKSSEEMFLRFRDRYFSLLKKHLEVRSGMLLPGVKKLLELLSNEIDTSEDHVGLLTGNFEKTGWMKVQHFEIDHHFSFGAFGDHHHDRDDVARVADRLMKEKGVTEQDTVWIIGDTPADVKCARAIGANVLAVATGVYSMQDLEPTAPDAIVTDFSESEKTIEILLGS